MPQEQQVEDQEAEVKDRLNVYMDGGTRTRIRRVSATRGGSESQNAVWLLQRALDWWEGLSREQREAV